MIMETKSSQYITKQILIVDAINSNNSNKTKPNFLSFPIRKKKKHRKGRDRIRHWKLSKRIFKNCLRDENGNTFISHLKFPWKGTKLDVIFIVHACLSIFHIKYLNIICNHFWFLQLILCMYPYISGTMNRRYKGKPYSCFPIVYNVNIGPSYKVVFKITKYKEEAWRVYTSEISERPNPQGPAPTRKYIQLVSQVREQYTKSKTPLKGCQAHNVLRILF